MKIIIILGKRINSNLIQNTLLKRLDTAMSNYNHGDIIILSGGKTNKKYNSEAYLMEQYLINNYRINKSYIIKETFSFDTISNAENTLMVVNILTKQYNPQNIIIVTSQYHMDRVMTIFNYFFNQYLDRLNYINSPNGINRTKLGKRIGIEKKYKKKFIMEYLA